MLATTQSATKQKAKQAFNWNPGTGSWEPAAGIQGGEKSGYNFYAQMYVGTSTCYFLGGNNTDTLQK